MKAISFKEIPYLFLPRRTGSLSLFCYLLIALLILSCSIPGLAQDTDTTDDLSYQRLVNAEYGNNDERLKAYQDFIKENTGNEKIPDILYLQAQLIYDRLDRLEWDFRNLVEYDEVINICNNIIAKDPQGQAAAGAGYLIVQSYDKQAKYPEKETAFRAYIDLLIKTEEETRAYQAVISLADQYYKDHQYPKAIIYYQMAIEFFPNKEGETQGYAQYGLIKCYRKLMEEERAVAEDKALMVADAYQALVSKYSQKNKRTMDAYYKMAIFYLRVLKDLKGAKEAFNKIIEDYPRDPLASKARSFLYNIRRANAQKS